MGKVLVMFAIPIAFCCFLFLVGFAVSAPSPWDYLSTGVVYDAPSASFVVMEDGTLVPTPKRPETIRVTTGQFTVVSHTGKRVQLLDVTDTGIRPLLPVSSRAVHPPL